MAKSFIVWKMIDNITFYYKINVNLNLNRKKLKFEI